MAPLATAWLGLWEGGGQAGQGQHVGVAKAKAQSLLPLVVSALVTVAGPGPCFAAPYLCRCAGMVIELRMQLTGIQSGVISERTCAFALHAVALQRLCAMLALQEGAPAALSVVLFSPKMCPAETGGVLVRERAGRHCQGARLHCVSSAV